MSNYELYVADILKQEKVEYVQEKSFSNLNGGKLRYDFYLIKQKILIELDGPQHTQIISKFYKTKSEFQHAQENDRKKNSYALAHNIPLYRIPYWDIYKLKTLNDMLKPIYRVQSKWHNDILARERLLVGEKNDSIGIK